MDSRQFDVRLFAREEARRATGYSAETAIAALKAWESADNLHQACGACPEVAELWAKARKLRALAMEWL